MMPTGFIALLAGWFVTEIGRQPWTVFEVIRTSHSISPAILGEQVAWSLGIFVLLYSSVFGADSYYSLKLISRGIPAGNTIENFKQHGLEATPHSQSPNGDHNV